MPSIDSDNLVFISLIFAREISTSLLDSFWYIYTEPTITGMNNIIYIVSCQLKVIIAESVTTNIRIVFRKLEKIVPNISATACVSLVNLDTTEPTGVLSK